MTVTASTRLRAVLDQAEPALRAAAAELWSAPGLTERYPRYLEAMHGVLRASVPLMLRASERCAALAPQDPVAAPLRDYLIEHAAEEYGHDVWLLEDLGLLGADADAVRDRQPGPAVARLVGPQYFWIEHHHPVALLGYIAVLEGNAPHPALAARIARTASLPAAAVRTIREHAELDGGHTAQLHRLLDSLRLGPDRARAVTVSALHTADALAALLTGLTRPGPDTDRRRAPTPSGAPA